MILSAVVLRRFLGRLVKLLLRCSLAFAALSAAQPLGLPLGVNCFNALVVGLLGIPGFGLLLMLNWLFRR